MTTRIGINGFGRMGRLAMRAAWDQDDLDFGYINDLFATAEVSAHLLEFDSVHGRWHHSPTPALDAIEIADQRVGYGQAAEPGEVPWGDMGIEIVLECSGKFRTRESLAGYFDRGVNKVIVSAPVKSEALNVVMGVNHGLYDPANHDIITAASCTTNCLAPVVKVLHENLGIRHGVITTIHAVTNTQCVVDTAHSDLRRARSSLMSMIPTTTGSATAITMIYPELGGKLNGLAVRVPLLNASLTDCVFEVERSTNADEVNELFAAALRGAAARLHRFSRRSAVRDRRWAEYDCGRWDSSEGAGLVRQRVGLRAANGRVDPNGCRHRGAVADGDRRSRGGDDRIDRISPIVEAW